MKTKMTKAEKNWVLYDVGNSAFVLLVSTIMPIYFNYLAGNAGLSSVDYLAYWGYATSAATMIVALLGPVFGTLADTKGLKKPIFTATMLIGGIGCLALGFARQWMIFLLIYIIAKTGFSGSLIFYDSMLGDITTEERMDNVSSQGYAWGYIGSCVPFVLCLGIVLGAGKIGISMELAMMISFAIVAVWWIGATIPLLKIYKQKHYVERQPRAIRNSFKRLGVTLKNVRNEKKIFLFLLAFFFYIDGVYTIIDMATAYGTALGFDSTKLLLALLVTQIVAFPFAIIFGRLSTRYKTERLITICIAAYLGIAVFAIFLKAQWQFWILAILVGMFQGGIQALSRSYFAKIIPPEKSGEYFGLMDICGKGASFLGTTVISLISQVTGKVNIGVGAISVFFVLGMIVFRMATAEEKGEVRKAVDASPELRSKKALIETFIAGINDVDDVMLEWQDYIVAQREKDLIIIIEQEKLKPDETRKFLENCFREGEVKTTGTDIDKLLPPVSRFGGGGARAKKKKTVIEKLMGYFEKYSGLGVVAFKAKQEEDKVITYDFAKTPVYMVAEEAAEYGKKED